MRPYFPRTAHDKSIEVHRIVSRTEGETSGHRIHHGHSTTHKVKAVCKGCNTGWMSRMETATKPILAPMIQGRSAALTALQQRTLVDWLVLKMMVWECYEDRPVTFTREETLAFAKDRTLPQSLSVWLFRTRIPHFAQVSRSVSAIFRGSDIPPAARKIPNIQTVVFGVGQFIAYIVHTRVPNFELAQHRQFFARPLWPPWRDTLRWPPMKGLTAPQIDYLANTLNRFAETVAEPFPS